MTRECWGSALCRQLEQIGNLRSLGGLHGQYSCWAGLRTAAEQAYGELRSPVLGWITRGEYCGQFDPLCVLERHAVQQPSVRKGKQQCFVPPCCLQGCQAAAGFCRPLCGTERHALKQVWVRKGMQ